MATIRLSDEALEIFDFLKRESASSKKERMIYNAVVHKLEILRQNPHYGDPLRKHLIPSYYSKMYGAKNLYRIDLPLFWRMLYTLTSAETEIEIITFILDVCEYKEYDKRFGYR